MQLPSHCNACDPRVLRFGCGGASAELTAAIKPSDCFSVAWAMLSDILTRVGHVGVSLHKEPNAHSKATLICLKPTLRGSAEALEGSRKPSQAFFYKLDQIR